MSIHQNFAKKGNLGSLKPEVNKLDVDKFKIVPNSLYSLKNKVDKLDVDKLELVLVDFRKLTNAAEKEVVEKTIKCIG